MANTIKGNQDGENGENESYTIPGCGSSISRQTVVREVKGNHRIIRFTSATVKNMCGRIPIRKRKITLMNNQKLKRL